MKRTWATVGLLVAVLAAATFWIRSRTPTLLAPTDASRNWLVYENEVLGFRLRYPGEWMRSEFNANGLVSFLGPNTLSFSVTRIDHDLDWLKVQARQGRYLAKDSRTRPAKLNSRDVEQRNDRGGNFDGTWDIETFVVPAGEATYLVGWSNVPAGTGHRHVTPEQRALGRELAATFELIPLRRPESVRYSDPGGHFSFHYPPDWQLVAQNGNASVRHGRNTWIDVAFWDLKMIERLNQQDRFNRFDPPTEWFAHRLQGRHGRENDQEMYVFPQGAGRVILTIFRTDEPPEVIRQFLDSLELQ